VIDWPETRLRLHLWLHHAWPFRVIAWLRSRGVPESEDFGKFGDSEFEPLTPEQYAVLANAEPRERGKVIDSLLPADDLEEAKRFAALGGAGPEIEKVPRRRTEAVADADLLGKGEQSNAKKS